MKTISTEIKKLQRKINYSKHDITQKIILHLANCMDFSFSYTLNKKLGLPQFPGRVLRDLLKADDRDFGDSITELKRLHLIEKKVNYDGSILISLTSRGKLRALNMRFKHLERVHKNEKWDGKWRMVAYDIPDEFKRGRDALRYRAHIAGFYELQKSLFLYPYDCQKEIEDFVQLFKLEKYVRFALLDFIDNQDFLLRKFKLNCREVAQ